MAGLLDLFGGGGKDDDPYADILTPAQRRQMTTQGLLAMAGAFADAGMPSRLPIPFGAALGKAAAALGTGQEAGMKAAIENALAAQKVRDLRSLSQFRTQFFGDQDKLNDLVKQGLGIGAPGAAPAGRSPAAAPAGTYLGPGAPSAAPAADAPLMLDVPYPDAAGGGLLGSDIGAAGEYGTGQQATGLLGPAPPAQRAAAISLDRFGQPPPPGHEFVLGPSGKVGLRALPSDQPGSGGGLLGEGSGGGSSAADLGAGGDDATPVWGPTFPQTAARGASASGDPLDIIARYESGGRNIMQQVIGPQGGYNPSVGRVTGPSSASGPWQMIDPTWRDAARKTGVDTEKYPTAISAPVDVQRKVAQTLFDEQGYAPWAPYNKNLAQAVGYTGGRGATTEGSGGSTEPDPYASLTPTPGGQPPAAPSAMPQAAMPGAPGMPQIPVPPGADPAKFNALLLELARRNAAAEVLGMGNPYGSMLSVLQGSPQYKAAIEAATEQAKRTTGLPFIYPEEYLKTQAGVPAANEIATHKATLDQVNKQIEQMGAAALDPATINVNDAKGGAFKVQGTRYQQALFAAGFSIPELGLTGPRGVPTGASGIPGLSMPSTSQSGGLLTPQAGGAGTPYREPILTPRGTEIATGSAKLDLAEATKYRQEGDDALEARTATNLLLRNPQIDWQGPGAASRQAFNRATASVLGLNTESVKSYEFASQLMGDALRKALRASDPNPTERQQAMMQASFPTPATSREGYEQGLRYMAGVQDWKIFRGEQLRGHQNANNGDPAGFRVSMSAIPFVVMRMAPPDQAAYMERLGRADHNAVSRLADQMEQIRRDMPNSQF